MRSLKLSASLLLGLLATAPVAAENSVTFCPKTGQSETPLATSLATAESGDLAQAIHQSALFKPMTRDRRLSTWEDQGAVASAQPTAQAFGPMCQVPEVVACPAS